MIEFAIFALYLCLSSFLIIIIPVMMVPGLSMKRKLLISFIGFVVFIPCSLLLYMWLGAPQLAAS
jgi:hypothetical protein